jgi:hypothetical protein
VIYKQNQILISLQTSLMIFLIAVFLFVNIGVIHNTNAQKNIIGNNNLSSNIYVYNHLLSMMI